MESNRILKGAELERLQRFCVSNWMHPKEHLHDTYGQLLRAGKVKNLQEQFESRILKIIKDGKPKAGKAKARALAVKELEDLRYGPTKITVYNVLLAYTVMRPERHGKYLECAEWLVRIAKVPVDGEDLSGTTVLCHAISTHPYLDTEFAELMLEGGAFINHRNRYGYTAAHDILNVDRKKKNHLKRARVALGWFLEKGGNVDIKDGDRISAREMLEEMGAIAMDLITILAKKDQEKLQNTDGESAPTKISRNAPCSCGSGRKFKKCCGGS